MEFQEKKIKEETDQGSLILNAYDIKSIKLNPISAFTNDGSIFKLKKQNYYQHISRRIYV